MTRLGFWATVDVGRRLEGRGWSPWSLSFGRIVRFSLNGWKFKGCWHASAHPAGCHAGGALEWTKGCPEGLLRRTFREFAGPGRAKRDSRNRSLYVQRAMRSVDDIIVPSVIRSGSRIARLSSSRRADLVDSLVQFLRENEELGWSPYSIIFRSQRPLRGTGFRGSLTSDLYWFHREGLYWNTSLSVHAASAGMRDPLVSQIEADLRKLGFRIAHRSQARTLDWFFDQDHLPTKELLGKARLLARWVPRA